MGQAVCRNSMVLYSRKNCLSMIPREKPNTTILDDATKDLWKQFNKREGIDKRVKRGKDKNYMAIQEYLGAKSIEYAKLDRNHKLDPMVILYSYL